MNERTIDPQPNQPKGGSRRWLKWLTVGGLSGVLLIAGIFVWYVWIRDVEDPFSPADLDEALAAGTTIAASAPATDDSTAGASSTIEPTTPPTDPTATDASPDQSAPTTVPATTPPTSTAAPAAAGSASWNATEASEVGYRVEEVLFGVDTTAVGRTNQVTGTLTIDGTTVTSTEFSVEVASITSDESRRDDQFRGRIMSADEFPTADFSLTSPIELGVAPGDGVEVTTAATGNLTLRGVTQPVTFEVTARQENGLVGVQGGIPVTFADYGIANPSFGGITVGDSGLVEFVLVFAPAA